MHAPYSLLHEAVFELKEAGFKLDVTRVGPNQSLLYIMGFQCSRIFFQISIGWFLFLPLLIQ